MNRATLRAFAAFVVVMPAWGGSVGSASPAAAAPPVTFVVNALDDVVDAQPGDGACRTAGGRCTLRAAIMESDQSPQLPHAIVLPAGRLNLTIPTQWTLPSQTADLKTDPSYGELNVSGTLTVRGAGANRTVIDGHGIDRVFSVAPTGGLALSDLTITGGDATINDHTPADIAIGGAVLTTGGLTLNRVAIVHNRADGGGGIFATPFTNISIRNSLIAFNTAVEGGGLRLDGGALIVNSTITGNSLFSRDFGAVIPDEITGYGGGIDHRGSGNVTIVNSTITNNRAIKGGGGYSSGQGYAPIPPIASQWPYRTYLLNTVIANNMVGSKVQNCHVSAMVIQSRGHNLASDGTCFLTGPADRPSRPARLGTLGAHGGHTLTQIPLPGSPLIEGGTNTNCPATDQRGLRRPQNRRCDIGAVEVAAEMRSRGRLTGQRPVPAETWSSSSGP